MLRGKSACVNRRAPSSIKSVSGADCESDDAAFKLTTTAPDVLSLLPKRCTSDSTCSFPMPSSSSS